MSPAPPSAPTAPRRLDASMRLLQEIVDSPVDPAYQANAARRERRGLPRSTSLASPRLVVVTLAVGLLFGISATTLNADKSSVGATRDRLVEQITGTRAAADAQAEKVRQLQAQVAAMEQSESPELARQIAVLERVTGTVAVSGPAVRIVMDDAPNPDDGSGSVDPRTKQAAGGGRVIARDIQIVVNSLWQSGAEAVAVNDQRIGERSAIRFAGDAILVNFRPLTRPYTITAIGDPEALPSAFSSGDGGAYLAALHSSFGIAVDITQVRSATLPPVTSSSLRYATPVVDRPTTSTSPARSPAPGPTSSSTDKESP